MITPHKKPPPTSITPTTILKSCDANNNQHKSTALYGTYRVPRRQCHQRHALPIKLKPTTANSAKAEINSAKSNMPTKNDSSNTSNNINNSVKLSIKHGQFGVSNNKSDTTVIPEPCRTCGRSDQPERLHSHPVIPLKETVTVSALKKMDVVPKIPSEYFFITSIKLFHYETSSRISFLPLIVKCT